MSNPREFLNNSVISPSLLPAILGKKTLWNMENTKWAETKGGTYSSASVVAVVSLSYTPLFTGSTIYYAAWINGLTTWQGYNYYPTAYKNGVDVSSWAYFKAGGATTYPQLGQNCNMITAFANPAVGTAISFAVNIVSSGNGSYPYYNGHAGIVAWEVVG